ncbi:C-terminal processing protease CtpA/Prc [Pullulanibacillus pueri]|uniref:Uncharacterized protein n=1 Tax=Pullulanibacillus pueri TaxID=1437324 RepID=A0A8J3EKE2_9BACL|nr:hypothetical protein [Pullulanibacillus pueri]MBM7681092.1 C-terminal processing protease CtpA/Prc [Pullulanibacillus pueri]GGH77017.1 hypothetical protein GCM10007096_08290 [Pullulanibacillus pueri]
MIDARSSSKVTVIGRATRGVLDCSNQAIETFEDEGYEFYYATSRSDRIDKGTGIDFNGIKPDVYVLWTPEHLEHDVDIEKALQLLQSRV